MLLMLESARKKCGSRSTLLWCISGMTPPIDSFLMSTFGAILHFAHQEDEQRRYVESYAESYAGGQLTEGIKIR